MLVLKQGLLYQKSKSRDMRSKLKSKHYIMMEDYMNFSHRQEQTKIKGNRFIKKKKKKE